MRATCIRLGTLATLLLAVSAISVAHEQSDSYLSISQPDSGAALSVRLDIALRELQHVINLDADADGLFTEQEVRQQQSAIVGYASSRLQIAATDLNVARQCPLRFSQLLMDKHLDVPYAALRFSAECSYRALAIEAHYTLLFDVEPSHRGLLEVRSGSTAHAVIFARGAERQLIELNTTQNKVQFTSFFSQGVWHIWEGYDHVLFLLTLLLPAVVLYRDGQWQPRESLRDCLLDVVKVVTAFTLAHSVTLTLGTLGWVRLPTHIVESAIAITVLLGALNMLLPLVQRRRWLVACGFGLIHGLAFASVLVDLGLQGFTLLLALLGFNTGVEAGQLAIIIVVVPLIHAWRRTAAYRRVLMPAGAVAIASLSAYWFVSRAFA